jgi:multidrug efflux pump subunit AcrA (membrane-fusion protein)
MGVVPFDTLKLARRLEGAGFPPKQAGDTAEALAEAMSGAELATATDLDRVRAELKAEIAALRTELKAEIAALRAEIELLRRDLTIRLGGMIVVAVGVILAAIRYLPPPHP